MCARLDVDGSVLLVRGEPPVPPTEEPQRLPIRRRAVMLLFLRHTTRCRWQQRGSDDMSMGIMVARTVDGDGSPAGCIPVEHGSNLKHRTGICSRQAASLSRQSGRGDARTKQRVPSVINRVILLRLRKSCRPPLTYVSYNIQVQAQVACFLSELSNTPPL